MPLAGFWSAQYFQKSVLLDNRVIAFVAKISFGIYILHVIVLTFVIDAIAKFHLLAMPHFIALGFLTFSITVAISTFSYRYFEGPILEWAHRIIFSRAGSLIEAGTVISSTLRT